MKRNRGAPSNLLPAGPASAVSCLPAAGHRAPCTLALCLLAACLLAPACGPAKPRANLILISIDTLRADHLGCLGHERPTSPGVDRIAREGLLFRNASATSPWTLPSHGSMLTGMYPSRLGLNSFGSVMPEDTVNLGRVLREAGFSTAAVVNSLFLTPEHGFGKGYDRFWLVKENHTAKGAAPAVINRAVRWLQAPREKPFFLFLHFYDVHSDYRSQEKYERLFAGSYKGPVNGNTGQLRKIRQGELLLNERDTSQLTGLYDAQIRQLDEHLSRLFDYLRSRDLLDETYLFITSDHGEEFLDHGNVLHGHTQYEELIRVPLILRGPGIPNGLTIDETVSLVDIMPTSLQLLGVDAPPGMEGRSLCPLWEGAFLSDRFIFAEADRANEEPDIKRAVRRGRYKLIHDLSTKKNELYDLAEDPGEGRNIAADHPKVVKQLLEALEQFMALSRGEGESAPLSKEEVEHLKRLGYL